ncbi:GNAT family N-acetyltransferase [Lacticaseibacillus pabuli]|uniref:GNAT family N-acetyltransferase n=1 Tax=Lacticaseibacillus pabuli TaxID=3025672 RepID=A0ABY7X0X4_9LACO|nr:GNAT family N-acetyltransferase [Lacticaseibacillus sp. KACC 23028]WDF83815.1 GNAT family N-acetyltransferase [Lacticaseibacillus sp. KACC 23028]
MKIKVSSDLNSQVHQDSVAIRQAVFVQEQHVPADLEVDAEEGRAIYFTGYNDDGVPVATLRLLPEDYGFHVQRVAVAKAGRGLGLGREMITAAIQYGKEHGAQSLQLGAQVHATGFYERLGFKYTAKPQFLDAGIPHREMIYTY